jgi:hypothetical protein
MRAESGALFLIQVLVSDSSVAFQERNSVLDLTAGVQLVSDQWCFESGAPFSIQALPSLWLVEPVSSLSAVGC